MDDLLTFEVGKNHDELFIRGDPSGLRRLSALLQKLASAVEQKDFAHEHLFASEWGGADLSSPAQDPDHECLGHVKIYVWPDSRGSHPYKPQLPNGV